MTGDLADSGTVYFEQTLQDIAFASEDLYEEATASIPGASQVSPQRVRELIADALIEIAVRSSEQAYGPNAKRQEQEKDQEQSNLKQAAPRKVPTGITTCPRCSKKFDPDEVTQYTDFGVRCPHCSQSIVL